MAAIFGDVTGQRSGDEKYCDPARHENEKNDPGKEINHRQVRATDPGSSMRMLAQAQ
ncbi:hypothetical protein [Reyranella sp.]|jgi:hypothetical protein|uniref:hypothetical protein n=1 Tax=Reyranella sp. TaxID=1929291 RepID=UPI002F958074